MATLADLQNANAGSIDIDWQQIETKLGFPVHSALKDFYSKITCHKLNGIVNFTEEKFIEKTGNTRNDTWISFNKCEGKVEYELILLTAKENAVNEILWAFNEWTGGNDFGHRAMIGNFYLNIGDILILFNNDTGKIEWIDCGYGYFDVYEENPNGVLANSIDDFLKKLSQ